MVIIKSYIFKYYIIYDIKKHYTSQYLCILLYFILISINNFLLSNSGINSKLRFLCALGDTGYFCGMPNSKSVPNELLFSSGCYLKACRLCRQQTLSQLSRIEYKAVTIIFVLLYLIIISFFYRF